MTATVDPSFTLGLQAGRLEGAGLPDLLWALCRAQKTGVLRLNRKQVEKSIYLDRGHIVFAASNQQDDRLGELLLRQGRIGLADLEQAVSNLGNGKRIGTLLVENDALSSDQLVDGVLSQVRRIVLDLFDWESGEYQFDEGDLPTDELITLSMSTGELLLQGIRSIRSFARIRQRVGTPRAMYRLSDDWRDAVDGVRLSEGEELLVVRLEQGEESVEGLCREVFLSNFEIYQTLWGLKVLGAIEEIVGLAESGEADWQGNLEEQTFAEVFVRAAHARETGILHVSQRTLERTFHFQEGRCLFATSNDPDDGLIAYLLRRGVISLSDREETAKRLLSNKRVGTILREIGVIDERDLEEMVRQQLAEIVYDTFCWEEGDFAFYAGELPTIEEITLESSTETLIAEGVRRVQSWTSVMEGCGGMDHGLALAERYLDVLDGLDAGADEWQVVTALKEAQPARKIASEVDLPDFRVCQILWTLRVLKAIELRSLEEMEREAAAAQAEREAQEAAEREAREAEAAREAEELAARERAAEEEAERRRAEAAAAAEAAAEAKATAEAAAAAAAEAEAAAQATAAAAEAVADEKPGTRRVNVVDLDQQEPSEVEAADDSESQEPIDEDAAATVRMPREEVEAAIASPTEEDLTEPEPSDEHEVVDESDLALADEAEQQAEPEEIEAASDVESDEPVDQAADEEVAQEPVSDWDPPENLESSISRFNAMQRLVFRTVRSEVGAGAVNFIRSCVDGEPNPIADAELSSDGTWDVERLRQNVVECRVEEPWELYHRLIEKELETLRSLIGEAKVIELQRQVEQIEESASR